MGDLAELVARSTATVGRHVELDLLGTDAPHDVAAGVAGCVADLGEVVEARFYEAGVGAVAGLVLDDGREVVVKLHRFNASLARLQGCVAVQAHLHRVGLPAPEPLLPVRAVGSGWATVEALLDGDRADGRDAQVRRSMAAVLRRFVDEGRAVASCSGLERPYLRRAPGDPLWPTPHDLRFDFAATAAGAGWIDTLAEAAVEVLASDDLPLTVGHLDWRTQNLAFAGSEVVAIYDWDSVAVASEPWIVGVAAGGFCIDWRAGHPDPPPTVDGMLGFVEDYEGERGIPFTAVERRVLDAANLSMVAYSARCQHSDQLLRPDLGDNEAIGWPRLLRERGGLGGLA